VLRGSYTSGELLESLTTYVTQLSIPKEDKQLLKEFVDIFEEPTQLLPSLPRGIIIKRIC